MKNLKKYVEQRTNINLKEQEAWLSRFHRKEYGSGEMILEQGSRCNHYYFIERGAVRIFFYKDGKEISAWLATESSFFTELESFNSGQASQYNIQTVKDCIIYRMKKSDFETLVNTSMVWNRFIVQVWQEAFIKTTRAIVSFQADFADERYYKLVQESDIAQVIPQKLIASFLGITPTSLSRIRGDRTKK